MIGSMEKSATVLCGSDVIARGGYDLQGKCGLITNHTGVLRDLSSTIDLLKEHLSPQVFPYDEDIILLGKVLEIYNVQDKEFDMSDFVKDMDKYAEEVEEFYKED